MWAYCVRDICVFKFPHNIDTCLWTLGSFLVSECRAVKNSGYISIFYVCLMFINASFQWLPESARYHVASGEPDKALATLEQVHSHF